MKNSFKIVIPVYNAEDYIGECLSSVISQDYEDYEVFIIDDCSSDKTWDIIKSYKSDKIFTLRKEIRSFLIPNLKLGIASLCKKDDDIIVWLDGDDWLYSKDVLSYLNSVYSEDVLATVGSFIKYSDLLRGATPENNDKLAVKPFLFDTKSYRKSGWVESHTHLRTFKHLLWKNIKDSDLRAIESFSTMYAGDYYPRVGDVSILLALFEMAGNDRIRFIYKTLCVYNNMNSLNDFKTNEDLTNFISNEIVKRDSYKLL